MRYSGMKVVALSAYFSIIVIIATMISFVAILLRLWNFATNLSKDTVQQFNERFS
jgi:hypothetical protein